MKDSSNSERRVWELLKLGEIGRRTGRSYYWTKPLELVEKFLASSFKSRNEAWGGALAMGNPRTFSRLASPSGKERTCPSRLPRLLRLLRLSCLPARRLSSIRYKVYLFEPWQEDSQPASHDPCLTLLYTRHVAILEGLNLVARAPERPLASRPSLSLAWGGGCIVIGQRTSSRTSSTPLELHRSACHAPIDRCARTLRHLATVSVPIEEPLTKT